MTEFLLGVIFASCYLLLLWCVYDIILRPVVMTIKDVLDKELNGDDHR